MRNACGSDLSARGDVDGEKPSTCFALLVVSESLCGNLMNA